MYVGLETRGQTGWYNIEVTNWTLLQGKKQLSILNFMPNLQEVMNDHEQRQWSFSSLNTS